MPLHWRSALVAACVLCCAARVAAIDAGGGALTPPGCYTPSAAAADYFPDKLQFAVDTTVRPGACVQAALHRWGAERAQPWRKRAKAAGLDTCVRSAWRLQVNVAQYFSVEYAGYYKYVRDLRGPELKTYILYQARCSEAMSKAR